MASNLRGYTADEVLNKVLNTSSDSIKVDVVSGSEYAEDSAHTSTDVGTFVLGVRQDAIAALGADGDYVPFQVNASGALYVEVASSSGDDSIYVDDADWTDSTSSHTLVGGLYQSSPQSITDGDTGPLQVNANGNLIVDLSATDNAVLDAMVVDLAALEVLSTAANVDHAAIEVLLTAANVDHAANEVLLTAIESSADSLISANHTDLVALEATLTAIETDIAANEVLLTAANVDHAANEALLITIDSDTNETKNALNNMLYGTAVAITAVSGGSDQDIESGATYEALYIGVGGDVTVTLATDEQDILFKNLASG